MRRAHDRIVLRIWLPFTVVLLVCIVSIGVYYPRKQGELYREATDTRLREMASAVALSVELSLEHDEFGGVQRAVELASSTEDFAYVALVLREGSGGERLFAVQPLDVKEAVVFDRTNEGLVVKSHPVTAVDFMGYVQVAVSMDRINEEVAAINAPVYQGLVAITLVSLVLFLVVARGVARPVVAMVRGAEHLQQGDYEVEFNTRGAASEVAELGAALTSLRDALSTARDRQRAFNEELEQKIDARTRDLARTQGVLLEAQRVAAIGTFEFDPANGRLEASPMFFQVLGLSPMASIDLSQLTPIFGERVLAEVRELLGAVALTGHRMHRDLPFDHPGEGAERRWLSLTAGPASVREQAAGMILGTVQDITIRRRTQEEVERLSMVARRTSNCVVITDRERRMTWVNDALLRLTGYELHEVIGRTPVMFQFEGTDPAARQRMRLALERREEVNEVVWNRGKHGNTYWLQLNIVPLFNEHGAHTGFMAVETDITERVQGALDLERSRNMFRVLVENLQGATYHMRLRKEPQMLFMSSQVEQILGIPVADFMERRADRYTCIVQEDELRVRARIQELIKATGSFDIEYRVQVAGEIRWIREVGQVYTEGDDLMLTATIADITSEYLSEMAIRHGSELITSLAGATTALLNAPSVLDGVAEGLPLFGRSLDVDRLCVFRIAYGTEDEIEGCGPVLTWSRDANGTETIEQVPLAVSPVHAFGPLLDAILAGRPYKALIEEVAHRQLAAFMSSQGVRQVLAVPITTTKGPWGFLCLDHLHQTGVWEEGNRRTIDTYVSALTSSIEREQVAQDREAALVERDQRMGELEAMTRFPDGDPNPVMRIAENGVLLYANRASEQVLGALGMELGAKVPEQLHHRLVTKDENDRSPMLVDTGERKFEMLCMPVKDFGFYNIYGTDVSAMHRLREMQEDAMHQERMSVLGRLTASIAHEINSPLGAVLGASRNLSTALTDWVFKELPELTRDDLGLLVLLAHQRMHPPPHAELRAATQRVRERLVLLGAGPAWMPAASNIAEMGWGVTPGEPWEALLSHASGLRLLNTSNTIFVVRESLRTIDFAAERAAKVVGALRTYIHQDEDRRSKPFDLSEQLRSVSTLFKASGRRGLLIDLDIPDGVVVHGVEDDLAQVWTNILSNAVQAIGDSGHIVVRTRSGEDRLLVEISNNGPMIPPEVQERMYDALYTTKKKGEGTGIGLNLVKRILDGHGGGIRCVSTEQLTTFTIELPLLGHDTTGPHA
jgi:PAS domain S-box-containing protein